MQKFFYNKTTEKGIVDISGVKTLEQIKKDYGDDDYEVNIFDPTLVACTIKNKKIEEVDLVAEKSQKEIDKAQKKADKEDAKNALKSATGLSQKQVDDLFN